MGFPAVSPSTGRSLDHQRSGSGEALERLAPERPGRRRVLPLQPGDEVSIRPRRWQATRRARSRSRRRTAELLSAGAATTIRPAEGGDGSRPVASHHPRGAGAPDASAEPGPARSRAPDPPRGTTRVVDSARPWSAPASPAPPRGAAPGDERSGPVPAFLPRRSPSAEWHVGRPPLARRAETPPHRDHRRPCTTPVRNRLLTRAHTGCETGAPTGAPTADRCPRSRARPPPDDPRRSG